MSIVRLIEECDWVDDYYNRSHSDDITIDTRVVQLLISIAIIASIQVQPLRVRVYTQRQSERLGLNSNGTLKIFKLQFNGYYRPPRWLLWVIGMAGDGNMM